MLPVQLMNGYVSIYGHGSIYGVIAFPKNGSQLRFGVIGQTYPSPSGIVAVGQTVLYDRGDSYNLQYDGVMYDVIPEQKIILIENSGRSR